MANVLYRLSRLTLVACIAVLVTFGAAVDSATGKGKDSAAARLRESLIKVAFLYNFARFTDWPAHAFQDSLTPFRFCVLGDDPFGAAFDSIAAKAIRGRTVALSRLASVREAARCHVLFVSESEKRRLAEILAAVRSRPVLTVADITGFVVSGGIIKLKTVEKKIRFDINLAAGRLAGLRFSSRFLSLATIVQNKLQSKLEN